ncbi:hypothetical protein [Sphingomonas sp.]|uniref:YkgJ family cysteine cluster protein n=1 Tax=Sphingomonas sp. TaxID=28214 RepID=UPI0017C8CB11|nr:hypothetical protein [Sphingomonas sp.]MBA3511584.1 hypothetical protein [Sphingomonas sp.]
MDSSLRRFACTQCGKCCNRSPEVELSEAAGLADVFVFRLMFRMYWLPDQLRDYLPDGPAAGNPSAAFYEKKRLLRAFAARKTAAKLSRDGKTIEYTKYLMISALALDTSPGACAALNGTHCGIHDRRPLSCRSVPFHYSRVEALAESGLAAFVATAGYRCDTSETADVVLVDGRIVAPEFNAARAQAVVLAERDRTWTAAILRRMKAGSSATRSLPALQEVEANAQFSAVTTSMRVAWQIAADVGLIGPDERDRLTQLQLHAIGQELATDRCSRDARETLIEMRAEYRHHLNSGRAIAVNG